MKVPCCVCGRTDNRNTMLCFFQSSEKAGIEMIVAHENEDDQPLFVCRDPNCLSLFFKKYDIPPKRWRELLKHIRSVTETKTIAEKLIGMSVRSGDAARGVTQVFASLEKGHISSIIVSEDQKKNTRQKIIRAAKKYNVPIYEYRGAVSFERAVGKKQCTCVGIFDAELSEQIKSDLNVIEN